MTDCRMRTIPAGRVLAGVLLISVALMSVCITIGYRMALESARETGAASRAAEARSFDFKRPEGVALVDHIGEMSGRLTRLEIEAAEMARRLGIAPSKAIDAPASGEQAGNSQPLGGPLLPFGDDAPVSGARAQYSPGDYGIGLSRLETKIELLDATLDHMAGILTDRDLTAMAYPNRPPMHGPMPRVSSGFGVRHDPFTGRLARHTGLDIPAAYGTAILASGGGRVLSAGFRGPYGKAIVIDHGHGLQTLYGHCSKLYVRAGELVMPRQEIAAVGSTGRSTGPHLHFEVIRNGKPVAPGQVLENILARNSN